MSKCDNCTEQCPQAELANEIAKGRMYAMKEVLRLQKELEQYQMGDRMTNNEAAKLIVELYGEFQRYAYSESKYAKAVAVACGALVTEQEVKMTNADKIRAMTDEELASFLREDETFRHAFFPLYCEVLKSGENPGFCDDDCKVCALNWLKQEVKENG